MNWNIKISVIIPIYNVEKYIARCTEALMKQTLHEVEYIFVNDCTKDQSLSVLQSVLSKYPERAAQVRIINHVQNKGCSAARNTGLLAARGEYIIYCDSDDWMDESMLEDMYVMAKREQADIVTCDFRMIYKDKDVCYHTINWSENKDLSLQNYIAYGWTVIWNMLVSRTLYDRYQLRSIEGYTYCEDFNLSVKLLFHAEKVVHLNKVLYNYNRLNINSIMYTLSEKTMSEEQFLYLDVINYLKKQHAYKIYDKQLCWRILKSKQEYVLNRNTYSKFLQLYPESHKYIWSCPFINIKLKIMMWSLVHHLPIVARTMLFLRYLKHGRTF